MVKKFVYGTPFETEAVVKEIPSSEGNPDYGTFSTENGFSFTTKLADEDMVFGLGEANRGINKQKSSFCQKRQVISGLPFLLLFCTSDIDPPDQRLLLTGNIFSVYFARFSLYAL